jgi:two-component system response regulator NreC
MSPITIILAEDHSLVRQGLRMMLEAEADFHVIGEAVEGLKVMDMVERLRPGILLLDIMLPGMNGLEIARQVHQHAPQTRCIMLSMYSAEAFIVEAFRNGAMGYVLKSDSAEILIEAIRTVAQGRRYLCPPFSEKAIEAYIQRAKASTLDVYDTLTRREHEIFHYMARGYKNMEISQRLSISPRTVEVHRNRIMQKLDLASPRELIRFALKRGILTAEDPDWETAATDSPAGKSQNT